MGLFEILKGEQPGIIKTLLNYENAGQFGEFSTEYALTNHNLPGKLVVLKNIYVPYQGRTSEIDLLMITRKVSSYSKVKITAGGSLAARTSLIGHNLCKMEKSTTSITQFAKTKRISSHFPRI